MPKLAHLLLWALVSTSPAMAQSGSSSGAPVQQQPCPGSPDSAPCAPPKRTSSGGDSGATSTDRFPFPGEPVPAAKPEAPAPGPAPDAPSSHPFPGDAPDAPGSSGSSSSSSSSSDSTVPDSSAADAGTSDASGRRLLKRVNPIGTKLQSPQEREAEDLSVARFYTDSGDLQGAYLRSQDAVKTAPDDPDAHCALAKAAQELKKRDEAIAEFKACLKLDPVEKEAKDARKQLARLK